EFLKLAQRRTIFAEVEVLGDLLRDGAATADFAPVPEVVAEGAEESAQIAGVEPGEGVVAGVAELLGERGPVDALMTVEIAVLGDDDGALEVVGDVFERHPVVADLERLAGPSGFGGAQLHERGAAGIAPHEQDRP